MNGLHLRLHLLDDRVDLRLLLRRQVEALGHMFHAPPHVAAASGAMSVSAVFFFALSFSLECGATTQRKRAGNCQCQ